MPRSPRLNNRQPQTTAQQFGSLIKSARDIMREDKGPNRTVNGCKDCSK